VGRGRLRQIAAQLAGEPADDDRVLEVAAVAGDVLGLAAAMHQQRLDTHRAHAAVGAHLPQRLPPIPGRLERRHHPVETGLDGDLLRPVQRLPQPPGRAREQLSAHHLRVVIQHRHRLLGLGQIDRHDRQLARARRRSP
jgi:hypothetical protein